MEGLVASFWNGRSVLVTGHTGFKGSWLVLWLSRLGARVTGYSLQPDTAPNLFGLAGVSGLCTSRIGDVCDARSLADVLASSRAEVVFHLAAQSLVRRGYADPVATYQTNVMGTVNLLQAVRSSPTTRVVVNVTTDKCYANLETARAFTEGDALGGFDPYSNSKACAEFVTQSFRDSYFSAPGGTAGPVAVATARAGNVIGGGDWNTDRLIPDIVKAFAAGKPVQIRNPHARRPWQHVLEPLAGYLLLAERCHEDAARYARAWNFGPSLEDVMPVSWVVERAASLWGGDARWSRDVTEHPHEATTLALDSSRARRELGWRSRLSIANALNWTIEWYRDVASGRNARDACGAQIADYEGLIST